MTTPPIDTTNLGQTTSEPRSRTVIEPFWFSPSSSISASELLHNQLALVTRGANGQNDQICYLPTGTEVVQIRHLAGGNFQNKEATKEIARLIGEKNLKHILLRDADELNVGRLPNLKSDIPPAPVALYWANLSDLTMPRTGDKAKVMCGQMQSTAPQAKNNFVFLLTKTLG